MSRTFRDARSVRAYFRKPRGFRQAIRNKVRFRARPPTDYENIEFKGEHRAPEKAADRMKKKGISRQEAVTRIQKKFKLSNREAYELTERIYE